MIYKGSCHCGKIAFEVEGEIDKLLECNCSICTKRGSLLWFVPREKLHLKTPESGMGTYLFNKKVIRHRFCPVCGCGPLGEATNPKTGILTAAINVRCLDGVDFSKFPRIQFDGRSI